MKVNRNCHMAPMQMKNHSDIKNCLALSGDLPRIHSSQFDIDDYLANCLTGGEQQRWACAKTDWTPVNEAMTRLSLMLGNCLRYDAHPLYVHCLKGAISNHGIAISKQLPDRARLRSFAEGLVDTISMNEITLTCGSTNILVNSQPGDQLDNRLANLNIDDVKIRLSPQSIPSFMDRREDLIRTVFVDYDYFDVSEQGAVFK